MTPTKFIVIVGLIVVASSGVSFAVQRKTKEQRSDPEKSWPTLISRLFADRQRLLPLQDLGIVSGGSLSDGRLIVAAPVSTVVVRPLAANDNRPVRKAEFRVLGAEKLSINYRPSPDDPEAPAFVVQDFDSQQPVKLVFLKHGGILKFTNRNTAGIATITIQ